MVAVTVTVALGLIVIVPRLLAAPIVTSNPVELLKSENKDTGALFCVAGTADDVPILCINPGVTADELPTLLHVISNRKVYPSKPLSVLFWWNLRAS